VSAELDHLFVLCSVGAPEAEALVELGFLEGSPNTHPGQGTSCRRFFFHNLYLELVWVHSPKEAQGEGVRQTGLWDRWSRRLDDACPFGIVLHPSSEAEEAKPPFAVWSYRPAYLPAGFSIEIATDAPPTEPAFFWLGFHRGPPRPHDQPRTHRLGRSVTSVRIGTPVHPLRAEAAREVQSQGLIAFEPGGAHLLELTLDGGPRGQSADLRPMLPVRFCW
jgi:hypothetical protein